jgi:GMP synthase-like glutamine amidotransferase
MNRPDVSVLPVAVLTHIKPVEFGLLGDALAEHELQLLHVALDEGDRLPGLDEVSGIVSLGGTMGVPDADRYPFLLEQRDLLQAALAAELPLLGLCLGAQLLTWAAGGSVVRMDSRDIAWYRLARSEIASDDPLFGAWPSDAPVLEWHLDQIVLPDSAELLADSTGPGASVFRVGSAAWGSQSHLELTPLILDGWLADPVIGEELRGAGLPPEQFLSEAADYLPRQEAAASEVFARFAKLVLTRQAAAISG